MKTKNILIVLAISLVILGKIYFRFNQNETTHNFQMIEGLVYGLSIALPLFFIVSIIKKNATN